MDVLEQFDVLGYDPIWEFPRSKLELKTVLGSGAFGEVWLGEATGMEGMFVIQSIHLTYLGGSD